jgi:hypothetical protein
MAQPSHTEKRCRRHVPSKEFCRGIPRRRQLLLLACNVNHKLPQIGHCETMDRQDKAQVVKALARLNKRISNTNQLPLRVVRYLTSYE